MTLQNLVRFSLAAAMVILPACEKRPAGGGGEATPKGPRFAFVINNPSPFWSYARAGLKKAEQDFGLVADFQSPNSGTVEEQNRILETILQRSAEFKGVAISPLDPKNQTEILNKVAAAMPLICHDSDAPASNRLFYVGTNNVDAGRLFGKLIREKMPAGGSFALFVGSLDALNAKQRREGIILELSDGAASPATSGQVVCGKWTLVDTFTDNADRAAAQQNVEAALRRFPDLQAVGGLWSYNTPQCIEALKSAGKLGQVKVFGFDEEEATLDAIAAGQCEGTIVQQPYEFGYQSMKYLKEIADGKKVDVPANKEIPVPALSITKDKVAEFRANLQRLRAASDK
ncbi:MAG: sugar-binding protein [Verrucomicrobiales bacterium]